MSRATYPTNSAWISSIQRSIPVLSRLATLVWAVAFAGGVTRAQFLEWLPNAGHKFLAVSADGSAVAGTDSWSISQAFRWTHAGGVQLLGVIPGGVFSNATAISGDGTTIVGNSSSRAFRWTSATGMVALPLPPGFTEAGAEGVNFDGSVVVGWCDSGDLSSTRAFRWTLASGTQVLGPTPFGSWSSSYGVSGDGSVIVGSMYTVEWNDVHHDRAFRWTDQGNFQGLDQLLFNRSSWATRVSQDGKTVIGSCTLVGGNSGVYAFRWTEAAGFQSVNGPSGGIFMPRGCTADGSVMVGSGSTAIMWTYQTGSIELGAYFASKGVNVAGWQFQDANDVSADGRVFIGGGTLSGQYRPWIVTLPCSAVPPVITPPSDSQACSTGTASFEVSASGAGTFSYQWQWRRSGQQQWLNVVSGANTDGVASFLSSGGLTPNANVAEYNEGGVGSGGVSVRGEFRCVVSNSCGSVSSDAALLAVCPADFDCNAFVNGDDFDAFVWEFEWGTAAADFNRDGFTTGDDFDQFVVAFEAGC